MLYKRILLKLSGEVLAGSQEFGIAPTELERLSGEISEVHSMGIEVGIVVGGGNIFRGISASVEHGTNRVSADYMGMLGTVINALALQSALETKDVPTRVMSAIKMDSVCEPFISRRARRHLEKGRVVIFACGTGNPYFTTDTAASLRGKEIEAEVVLKGTKVDGIYDRDPKLHSDAKLFRKLSFQSALERQLKVMDASAVALCSEGGLPIKVFNVISSGNIKRVVTEADFGTLVSEEDE